MSYGYITDYVRANSMAIIRAQRSAGRSLNTSLHGKTGTSLFVDFGLQFQVASMIVMVFGARSNERPVLLSDGVGRSLPIVLPSHRCSCMDEFRALDSVFFIGSPNK